MVSFEVRSPFDIGQAGPLVTGIGLMLLCAGAYVSVVLIVSAMVDNFAYVDGELPFIGLLDYLALPGGRHAS